MMDLEKSLKETEIEYSKKKSDVIKRYEAFQKIKDGEYTIYGDLHNYSMSINLGRKDFNENFSQNLVELRKVFGKLEEYYKHVVNPEDKLVEVVLKCPIDNVYIKYTEQLEDDAPCKIVESQSTSYSLVCEK